MTPIIIGIILIVVSAIVAVVNMVTAVTNDNRSGKSLFATHGLAIVGNVVGFALVALGILVLLV